jgi:hypothetical protein
MSTGQYSLVLTATASTPVGFAERNAEHQNHINNANPAGIGGYSDTAAEMRTTVDPYPGGAESLSADLAGELARLRYLIAQLSGETYWYQDPDTNIAAINTALTNVVQNTQGSSYRSTAANVEFTSSWANLDGTNLIATLTVAGTYLIIANLYIWANKSGGSGASGYVRLYNSTDAAEVTNSQRGAVYKPPTDGGFACGCSFSWIVTIAAAKTLTIQGLLDSTSDEVKLSYGESACHSVQWIKLY